MVSVRYSETLVNWFPNPRRRIKEDFIPHSYCSGNPKSYKHKYGKVSSKWNIDEDLCEGNLLYVSFQVIFMQNKESMFISRIIYLL
jgi:hypothetical protein